MKKILRLLLVTLMVFTLAGCSVVKTNKVTNEIHTKTYEVGKVTLDSVEKLITELTETKAPAVLTLKNYQKKSILEGLKLASFGSGGIYSRKTVKKNGDIVDDAPDSETETYLYRAFTNRHVIKDADKMRVYFPDEEEEIDAKVLGYDDKTDMAVIEFRFYKKIQPLEFADSNKLKKGQFVVAMGTPNMLELAGSATLGIVSSPRRFLSDDTDGDGTYDWEAEYIQHDTAINPGNSGGPLFNLEGKVVGMNTLKFAKTDIEGLGFSVPSSLMQSLIPYLEKGEKPVRYKLGISIRNIRDIDEAKKIELGIQGLNYGNYVFTVENGSIAENGGLKPGDVITHFDGVKILQNSHLTAILNSKKKNDTATVTVLRKNSLGEFETKTLTFNFI